MLWKKIGQWFLNTATGGLSINKILLLVFCLGTVGIAVTNLASIEKAIGFTPKAVLQAQVQQQANTILNQAAANKSLDNSLQLSDQVSKINDQAAVNKEVNNKTIDAKASVNEVKHQTTVAKIQSSTLTSAEKDKLVAQEEIVSIWVTYCDGNSDTTCQNLPGVEK
jgi:membrane-bound lytic murein transglycosylase B